jgi:hypothetical protein
MEANWQGINWPQSVAPSQKTLLGKHSMLVFGLTTPNSWPTLVDTAAEKKPPAEGC